MDLVFTKAFCFRKFVTTTIQFSRPGRPVHTIVNSILISSGQLQPQGKDKTQTLSTVPVAVSEMNVDTEAMGRKRQRSSDSAKGDHQHRTGKRSSIICPPVKKGMTLLDKTSFQKDFSIPTIVIYEDQLHPEILRLVKPYLLKIQGIKPVQEDVVEPSAAELNENNASRKTKKIYLNPDLVGKTNIMEFVEQEVKLHPTVISTLRHDTVTLSYDNWTWNQIFESVLPDNEDKLSSFSHIGHIVHLNLRDHLLPYKQLIGQVFLDKITTAKTVVNKLNSIDNTYRNFQMEILAGDEKTVVHLKENRCEYEFDFKDVYWNSRLSAEHERLVKMVQGGDVLYDVFAGVGPFAVPAGKKKCQVLANDLNPESFKWLQHNVIKNKVYAFVRSFNQDGREFIKETLANDLKDRLKKSEDLDSLEAFDFVNKKFHVAMNLPAIAVEFLDAFWGILKDVEANLINPQLKIVVHVYCFIKDIADFKEKASALVEEKLMYKLPKDNIVELVMIRNVAPNKEMLRVSFLLPHEVMMKKDPQELNSLKRKYSDLDS